MRTKRTSTVLATDQRLQSDLPTKRRVEGRRRLQSFLPLAFCLLPLLAPGADDLKSRLQLGLLEEEANHNLPAAITAYQSALAQFDKDHELAASAVFRLGECYRKLEKTNEAVGCYQRVVREFADQTTLARLSRQNLAGLGAGVPAGASGGDTADKLQARVDYETNQRLLDRIKQMSAMEKRQLLPTLVPDALLTGLLNQYQETETKLAAMLVNLGPNHPEILAVKAVQKKINEQINERLDGIVAGLEVRVAVAKAALGTAPGTTTGSPEAGYPPEVRAKLKTLLTEQVKIAEDTLAQQQRMVNVGVISTTELARFQREAIARKRDLLAVEAPLDPAQRARWEQLLLEEIKLAERAVEEEKKKLAAGRTVAGEVSRLQLDVLTLKRELVMAEAGQAPLATARPVKSDFLDVPVPTEEEKELSRIQAMLKDSPDLINAPGTNSLTPLLQAANAGNLSVARFLLANKADANARGRGYPFGNVTALHIAARGGNKAMVELLLKHGANANAMSDWLIKDGTPLLLAAREGYQAVAEALLAGKADVNLGPGEFTPLDQAAQSGHKAMVELLLQHGADANAKTVDGWTPMHYAAEGGSLAVAEILLAHKTAVDPKAKDGTTPLAVAVEKGQIKVAEFLLNNGAKVEAVDGAELTPLQKAVTRATYRGYARYDSQPEMVRLLLRAGADPNKRFNAAGADRMVRRQNPPTDWDTTGSTPLLVASYLGDAAVVEALLAGEAKANVKSGDGKSPLHFAVEWKSLPMLKAILAHSPDVELRDRDGDIPLMRAVLAGEVNICESLLKAGAKPNATDLRDGMTPLFRAAGGLNKALVQLLLDHKADVNHLDQKGRTILDLIKPGPGANNPIPANPETYREIVALLLKHGARSGKEIEKPDKP